MTEASRMRPNWRSLLFVPANKPDLIAKAAGRGADAVILDLEDAVPDAEKAAARACLAQAIPGLHAQEAEVLVRINGTGAFLDEDIAAAVRAGVAAIVVPKAETEEMLEAISEAIAREEAAKRLPAGEIGIVALIETPGALFRLSGMASVARVIGFALGSEDLSLALGVSPSPACLTLPCQMLALAAASGNLMAFGLPDSLANFNDLAAYEGTAAAARAMGVSGALCIHPKQVEVINRVFIPSPAEIAWAREVVDAWEAADGALSGAVGWKGRMLDKPVVERARALLRRCPMPVSLGAAL